MMRVETYLEKVIIRCGLLNSHVHQFVVIRSYESRLFGSVTRVVQIQFGVKLDGAGYIFVPCVVHQGCVHCESNIRRCFYGPLHTADYCVRVLRFTNDGATKRTRDDHSHSRLEECKVNIFVRGADQKTWDFEGPGRLIVRFGIILILNFSAEMLWI